MGAGHLRVGEAVQLGGGRVRKRRVMLFNGGVAAQLSHERAQGHGAPHPGHLPGTHFGYQDVEEFAGRLIGG